MSSDPTDKMASSRAFERKVRRARLYMVLEQLWLRLWVVLGVAGAFVLVSLLGVWPMLGELAHMLLAGVFGVAMLAALVFAARIHWPSRDEAIRRIEAVSGVPHRPATSYEDTLSASSPDPATMELWRAHRKRMADLLARLKPGTPKPRTDRYDPYALRALLVLFIATLGGLLGTGSIDRVKQALQFGQSASIDARLDAWIAPPPYTGRPPVMLADGALPAGSTQPEPAAKPPEAPERSILIVRASGSGIDKLTVEEIHPGGPATVIPAPEKKAPGDVAEIRHELRRSTTLRVLTGKRELARWRVDVIPDRAPKITLTKAPELTPRGSMKLTYKVEDDYGLSGAEAKIEKGKKKTVSPDKAWAQAEPLKGPRWPEQRPPPFQLRLPPNAAKEGEQHTFLEVASHPWAGLRVKMVLEVKDVAGQIGRSEPVELVLPEKRFTKPLALAVVEQRRKLIDDHRYRDQVRAALDALTLAPEGFIDDIRVYLGLRTVYHRLDSDRTRAGMRSAINQLWHIALRIEDGDLSDAERRLKEAQEKLAKALESGASDEEIEKLMAELKQALNEYMQQLAKEQGDEMQEGSDPNQQMLSQQDLDQMMKNLEESAKNGSREQAQQLLSEMQDLMERLQSGKMTEQQRQQNRDMNKAMDELGDMAGKQQKLMDETFEEQRKQDGQQGKPNVRKSPGGDQGKKAESSRSDNPWQNQQRNRAQRGEGQQSQGQQGRGQQGMPDGSQPQGNAGQAQDGDGAGIGGDGNELRQRQKELRDRLAKLQRDLKEKGLGGSEKLQGAEESMERAEEALERGDLAEATEHQGDALEQMREGGQEMAEQMAKNSPQRTGRNGDTPRDPLGRPQRSQGPDLGTSVKVPDQIDQQRAREILEELRRRSSEASRPTQELDYLERLLKRF